MGKPKRPCEQLEEEEEEEEAQQGVLVGGEERLLGDVVAVVIIRITIATIMTTTMTTMMEVDLLVVVVEEVLGEEGEGLVREEQGVGGVMLEMPVRVERGGLGMVCLSLLANAWKLTYQMMEIPGPVHVDQLQLFALLGPHPKTPEDHSIHVQNLKDSNAGSS